MFQTRERGGGIGALYGYGKDMEEGERPHRPNLQQLQGENERADPMISPASNDLFFCLLLPVRRTREHERGRPSCRG